MTPDGVLAEVADLMLMQIADSEHVREFAPGLHVLSLTDVVWEKVRQ